MCIAAIDGTVSHRASSTHDARATHRCESVSKSEYEEVVAVGSPAAAFNSGISSEGKIDVECAGKAVRFRETTFISVGVGFGV